MSSVANLEVGTIQNGHFLTYDETIKTERSITAALNWIGKSELL